MQTTKTVMREAIEVDAIACNLCGASCLDQRDPQVARGLIGAKAVGGYGDTFPADCEVWRFDLCEPCLAWLVSLFRVPVAATGRVPFMDRETALDDADAPLAFARTEASRALAERARALRDEWVRATPEAAALAQREGCEP